MAEASDRVLDPMTFGSLYPSIQVDPKEDAVRIELDVTGSGEISAAISLVRTVCPFLYMGTYSRAHSCGQIVYVRVAASAAQLAVNSLKRYGFRVTAISSERLSEQK